MGGAAAAVGTGLHVALVCPTVVTSGHREEVPGLMALVEMRGSFDLGDPLLVLAISGWVDGGMVATEVGQHLAGLGRTVAEFRPDEIFDYQSSRPSLELSDGTTSKVDFPTLSITAVEMDDVDLLVLSGREPNLRWRAMSHELAELAGAAGVTRVVAVGAVPAMVSHTRPAPIIVTSSDPAIEPSGLPAGRLVVPAALVNVLSHHISDENGIPQVGFWAQVPHYVSGAYWPGVEALMGRLAMHLDIRTDTDEIRSSAREVLTKLDEAVAERPEAQRIIHELEKATPGFTLDDDAALTDEIEDFLRTLGDDDA